MISLLGSTLMMMALTFAIGFIVAGVIKSIAFIADKYDFSHSHKEELLRLKRMRKFKHQLVLASASRIHASESYHGVSKGIPTGDLNDFYESEGNTDYGLMDYYYPSKSQIELIENQIDQEEEKKKKIRRLLKKSSTNSSETAKVDKKESKSGEKAPVKAKPKSKNSKKESEESSSKQ